MTLIKNQNAFENPKTIKVWKIPESDEAIARSLIILLHSKDFATYQMVRPTRFNISNKNRWCLDKLNMKSIKAFQRCAGFHNDGYVYLCTNCKTTLLQIPRASVHHLLICLNPRIPQE